MLIVPTFGFIVAAGILIVSLRRMELQMDTEKKDLDQLNTALREEYKKGRST